MTIKYVFSINFGTRDLQYEAIFFFILYTVLHQFLYRDREKTVHTLCTLMIIPFGYALMFTKLFQTLALSMESVLISGHPPFQVTYI